MQYFHKTLWSSVKNESGLVFLGGGARPSLSHSKTIVTYEIKSEILFYLFRPNTNVNVQKFTKHMDIKTQLIYWDLQTQFICHETFCDT